LRDDYDPKPNHAEADPMPEHTSTSPASSKTASSATPLLDALRALLVAHRPAFGQERTFLRAQALILGHLFAFARRTITQALIALGLTEHDWSAFSTACSASPASTTKP
jgi:hypothetical protein